MSEARTLRRRDYALTVETLAPMHLGSGESAAMEGGEGEVRRIQRDHAGAPFLPGSAIKGALRAALRDDPAAAALFGDPGAGPGAPGMIGALLVRGAALSRAGDARGLPDADGHGVFVLSRTAIDAGRGAAQANRLHHAEMVAPGARFELRLRLETRGEAEPLEKALLRALAPWAAPHGGTLGADGASGSGRVRLVGKLRRTDWTADASGRLLAGRAVDLAVAAPQAGEAITLRLRCDGPYLSRDPAWTAARRRADGREDAPHLLALRRGEAPFVTGQAVSGALRARMAWLDALAALREGRVAKKDLVRLDSATEAAGLSSAGRLFGVTGFRGLLQVEVGTATRAGAARTASVRLDRFSGGVMDNALFVTEADRGVRLTLRLSLDRRAEARDRDALEALVADLRLNGLELGHGVARGFGWFMVEAG